VLIASYNTRALLLEAITSARDEPGAEIIVVDNASTDASADAVENAFADVVLVREKRNLGFAAATNRAAAEAHGEFLLLLNPDARLLEGALARLMDCMAARPQAATVGPALVYPDGRTQAAAFCFPGVIQVALDLFPVDRLMDSRLNGRLHHSPTPRQIDHPLGACMLIRRSAWDDVGPLDEGYFMYLEEVDWCRRAQARGWEIWYVPSARVVHHAGSATRKEPGAMFAQLWRSRLRYYQRHHGPMFNRLIHVLVRVGLAVGASRGAATASVRQLVQ
jgi:GT2 family glycosyltransferase